MKKTLEQTSDRVASSHFLPLTNFSVIEAMPSRQDTATPNTHYFGDGYKIELYTSLNIDHLNQELLMSVAECYADVFNESWGEAWTQLSAYQELTQQIHHDKNRKPILTILYKEDVLIGFALALLTAPKYLASEYDMPFSLPLSQKKEGLRKCKYLSEKVLKKDRILLFRELGIRKQYRSVVSPLLCYHLFQYALMEKHTLVLYWTNVNSRAFKWGLGMGWRPFHFFISKELLLMHGNVEKSFNILNKLLNLGDHKRLSYEEIFYNVNSFLLKVV